MDAKEDIRSRLNIEDVIGEYVQLKRAGRNFKGLSPFSGEKTPSFVVSPDKHIWHDFSSNKGGDIFSFVMEVEGLDFRGAIELLARKAGVDLSQYQNSNNGAFAKKKERLYQILELATRFYQQNLVQNRPALEYVFKKRGLSKQIAQQFRIGYAPNHPDALVKALLKRGFKNEEIKDSGLSSSRRAQLSDMFHARMMVPLSDVQGRVVGFTARLIEDRPNSPKYINTPQTLLYDKGRQVFGLHLAKEAIRQSNYVVIVEGNLDVLASHQAGVAQVVATAGTAMTEQHLKSLSRLTSDIRLCFDRDKAGIAATERAIGISSRLGLQLSIITVPDGFKDPDELIKADPQKWQQVIDRPQDALEWLLDYYASLYDLSKAEGKRQVTTKLINIITELVDPVAREHYLNLLAKKTNASIRAVTTKLDQMHQPKKTIQLKPNKATKTRGRDNLLYQDHLLGLAWVYPELRDSLGELDSEDLEGELRQNIFNIIKKQLPDLQSDDIRVKIKELELIVEQKYSDLNDSLYLIAKELSKRALIARKIKQKNILAAEIADETDQALQGKKNQSYKKLIKEIESLKH